MAESPSSRELLTLGTALLMTGMIGFGLISRYRRAGNLGNWMVLVPCLPPLALLWFPPIPLVGLIAIVGALSDVFASRKHPELRTT